jgi:hypothetical protein
MMNIRKVPFFLLAIFFLASSGAQSLSLSAFNADTTGFFPDGSKTPLFVSTGTIAGRFIPAYWLRLQAQVSITVNDTVRFFHPLPEYNIPGSLSFDTFSVEFPSAIKSPVDISVFSGYFDKPESDSLLRTYLKTEIPKSEFHEKPAGMVFSPETDIYGTGISFVTVPGNRNLVGALYGYWNSRTGNQAVSTWDLRLAGTTETFLFNAFSGFSVTPASGSTSFRGGFTALFGSGSGNELYAEAGIRSVTYGTSHIDRNLYLLFEPRLHWDHSDLFLSFFSSPVFPVNNPSYIPADSESNYLGANILAAFGNLERDKRRCGVSILGSINPLNPGTLTPFTFSVSPFFSMMVSDFLFDITAVIKPLLLDHPYSMGELRIQVKAVY